MSERINIITKRRDRENKIMYLQNTLRFNLLTRVASDCWEFDLERGSYRERRRL